MSIMLSELPDWSSPIGADYFVIVDSAAVATKKVTFANLIANCPGALLLASSDGGALGSATKMWSDLFLASAGVIDFNNGNMRITHAAGVLSVSAGIVGINDTANGNMTTGLIINQGAADNEILALKSSDVAHGMTLHTETDTFMCAKKRSATGGVELGGYEGSGTIGINVKGSATADDVTKSTAGTAYIQLVCLKGPNNDPGADANLVAIMLNGGTRRFLFDADGSGHADVAWTTYDEFDDLALITDMEAELVSSEDAAKTDRRHMLEASGIIGKGSWHTENGRPRAMINFTRLAQLHHGALIQVAQRFTTLEQSLVTRLAMVEKQLDLLNASN